MLRSLSWKRGSTTPAGGSPGRRCSDLTELEEESEGKTGAGAGSAPSSTSSPTFGRRSASSVLSLSSDDPSTFSRWVDLPVAVRLAVLEFIDVHTIMNISLVSKDACSFSRCDIVWRRLFRERFAKCATVMCVQSHFLEEYRLRLEAPHVGDEVQVLWEGAFNLLSQDNVTQYEGRAWWTAVVVGHRPTGYLIHYPQWESEVWDEWVPRERIRWPPSVDTESDIQKGDFVEMQCMSSYGLSPWLECRVQSVKDGVYNVGDVIRTGSQTVPREALRLVRSARRGSFRRHVSGVIKLARCVVM